MPFVLDQNFHIFQVIPAENLVAAFQGCKRTVLAVTTNSSEAQVFLEVL